MSENEDALPVIEPTADLEKGVFDPRAYWRANVSIILSLLAVWGVVSYGLSVLLAEWLNQFSLGHLPLGFWFAQQGSIYVFVVLVFVYAFLLDRLDRKYNVRE